MRTLTLEDLCIHQVCLWKQCGFVESLDCLARHGITKTAIWRPMLEEVGIQKAITAMRVTGFSAISICPLVLYDPENPLDRQSQREQNLKCLEEAAELGVLSVVTITGGLNSVYNNIPAAREAAVEELSRLIPKARKLGLLIALEPLHPMVCGMRSVISTVDEACEILDALDSDDVLRLALDTYAVWWDGQLQSQILQVGDRISNFHVSDWLPDTRDLRLDRGMPGDGLIDNALIRSWVEEAGFSGPVEVEIFSERDWWLKPPDTVVEAICKRLPIL
jgi:sugar phosphate isomerase/epimerase